MAKNLERVDLGEKLRLNTPKSNSTTFVLLSCIDGETDEAIEYLKKINSIKEINPTDGLYDLVIRIESKTNEEFRQIFNHKIRSLDSVKYTMILQTIDNL
ncbi:MAG TPA: Lrp/AsnC ligand binding domain-containing protein [Candidatus Nitrosotenuis sp.]|nr:Lrp/AsnC ligand binding domain-containing protein [Candidatus Nitrosotenuis sp.]